MKRKKNKTSFMPSEFEHLVTDWTQRAENKVTIETEYSTTTQILSMVGGMLMFKCERCECWRRGLEVHPNGRGLVCSQCAANIAKEMPEIKE